MADIAELGFTVHDDALKRAEERLLKLPPAAEKAKSATDKFNKSADDGRSKVDRLSAGVSNATSILLRFASGVAAGFSVSVLANYVDAWSDMQSRVGAAIKDMEAAPALMSRIVDIANASYSPLAQTVEIYGRNAAVLRDLGRSASETADFTESLNHMLVITATRGERAEGVQNALSKAMAVGKLQADGLETVLASGGRVAEALAAELGTTVSGLRAFAAEGKITGDVIARAIIKPLADVREEAAKMPATITDAFTILNNNVTQAIGTLDKASGASSAVAGVIIMLAENLNLVGAGIGGVAAVIVTALVPSLIAATGAMLGLTAAFLSNPLGVIAVVIGLLVARIITLVQEVGGLGNAFQIVKMTALDVWDRIKAGASSLVDVLNGASNQISASFTGTWANILQGFISLTNAIAGPGNALSMGAADAWVDARNRVNEYTAASEASFKSAQENWGKATGPGLQMDIIEQGAGAFGAFASTMGVVQETTAAAGTAIDAAGQKAADAYAKITEGARQFIAAQELEAQTLGMTTVQANALRYAQDLLNQATEGGKTVTAAQRSELMALASDMATTEAATVQLTEAYKFGQTQLGTFLSTFRQELMAGTSLWDSFGKAAVNVLDNIANKALEMASNSIWDMIFGGIMGGLGGGLTGGAGKGFVGGGSQSWGGFASGGYTGDGSRSAIAGAVHGQEYVLNAAATQRIGVANLNAMNDNMPVNLGGGSGDTYVVHFSPQQNISGMGLTMQEAQELIRVSNTQMMDELPDVINGIQADPRKRKVRAG